MCTCACGEANKKPMDSAKAVEKERKPFDDEVAIALKPILDDIKNSVAETIGEKYAQDEHPAVEIHHKENGDLIIMVRSMK